ncbi:MAG TPA: zinc-ribbon domain-containing protein, partial [Polyangiaceae bacterium]|nr:zinc-ribbon domain-containing protein [Polyangiaceae bacterium]
MDVRCNRCGTEYEFDDALISERGTTVKCTNCGLQFKVYPSHHSGGPERWVVRTSQGRELVFTSLRELQRGIADRKVGPSDMLTRGQKPSRPLSSIAELEPFFQSSFGKASAAAVAAADRQPRTLHGVAPPANSIPGSAMADTVASPFAEWEVPEPPLLSPISSPVLRAESPMMDALSTTLPAAEAPPDARAAIARLDAAAAVIAPDVAGIARPRTDPGIGVQATQLAPPEPPPSYSDATVPFSNTMALDDFEKQRREAAGMRSSPGSSTARIPLETVPRSSPHAARGPLDSSPRSSPRGALDSTPRPPISGRGSFHSYDELPSPAADRAFDARRARSRWIVGVVAIGMVGLVGATVGRRYLVGATVPSAAPAAVSDNRVKDFLTRGNQLADEGDYEAAQEELVKASALAEKDVHVLAALARLETLRADVFWLKLRLLDPASTELVAATHRELGRRVGKARQAADRAFAAAPDEPIVIRARVDSMRLSGESDKAREWIAPVSSNASQPENAFVLAALDLSDAAPVWASVIDRLRTAAAGEREPGRARAALIYALARADRVGEARGELSKLEAEPKPHVLLDELRGFLSRFPATAGATPTPSASAALAVVDVSKLPKLDTSVASEDKPSAGVPSDFRAALSQAASAVRSGDYARAETLYNAALANQPGNVEALSGLGDLARRRGDAARAAQLYDQVLAQNPSYLPAMISSADQKWASGNRAGALLLYHRIVDQVGAGSDYGQRAQARINEAGSAPAAAAPAPAEAAPARPAAPAPAPAPPSDAPVIDTTDLP